MNLTPPLLSLKCYCSAATLFFISKFGLIGDFVLINEVTTVEYVLWSLLYFTHTTFSFSFMLRKWLLVFTPRKFFADFLLNHEHTLFFLISKLHIPPVGFDPTTSPSTCSCGRMKCHLSQSLLAHGHTLVSLHAWIALETSFIVTPRFFGFSRMDQQSSCLKV